MARGQDVIVQDDFGYGIVRNEAPHRIDPRGVFNLFNSMLDESASPYKRGGTANKSNAAFGATGIRWLHDAFFDAGQRTLFANSADFGVLDADDATPINLASDGLSAPAPAALLEGMLFIGGGWIYGASRKDAVYSTGTVSTTVGSKTVTGSGTTWNTLVDAGMLFQTAAGERVYVVASIDSTTQITLRDNYEGTTAAGKTYSLNPLYKIAAADPYPDAAFYAVIANRLVWAFEDSVFFSEIQRPHDDTVTIEGAEVTNRHDLPEGSRVLGFSPSGPTLLAATAAGTWGIDGLAFNIVDPDGNPNHRVQLLARDLVLWSNTGLAGWSQATIFPALDGIYLVDGVEGPVRISKPIDNLYRSYIQRGYRAGRAEVYRGHYFLPVLSAGGSAVKDLLVCRLDRPVEVDGELVFPWSRQNGNGGRLTALAIRTQITPTEPLLLGAEADVTSRVVDASHFFEPDADHKNDADGTTHPWELVTRDYPTGNMTVNMVRHFRALAELIDAGSDDPKIIFDYGFGHRDLSGDVYGQAIYGTAVYGAEGADEWFPLDCVLTENDGTVPVRCRVNQPTRYIRFRARCVDPVAELRLRSLDVSIRPSEAVRR